MKTPVKCFRCGGKHLATACKFIDAECFNCGKKGHTYRVCLSKGKPSKSTGKRGRPQKPQKANTVTTEGNCFVEHLMLTGAPEMRQLLLHLLSQFKWMRSI